MNNSMPNDPNMLFSYLNMMLRDIYSSLEDLCADKNADMEEIISRMETAGFEYDRSLNQFR